MSKRYPQELEERAVRTVLECEKDYETRYGTVKAVANKVDIGNESLRGAVGISELPIARHAQARRRASPPPARIGLTVR